MMFRRSIAVAAGVAALVAPLEALAQIVTTGPAEQAPTLAMPLIFLLALALVGVAAYRLRRVASRPILGLALVAAVTVLAGLGYATGIPSIMISGKACGEVTMRTFDPFGPPMMLMSECPNMIRILDIQLSCANPPMDRSLGVVSLPCSVGGVLHDGDSCELPTCTPG